MGVSQMEEILNGPNLKSGIWQEISLQGLGKKSSSRPVSVCVYLGWLHQILSVWEKMKKRTSLIFQMSHFLINMGGM